MKSNYKKILVATDGSKGSKRALETAIELSKQNNAHLDILSVLDLNSLEYGGAGIALDGQRVYDIEQINEKYLLDLKKTLVEKYNVFLGNIDVHLRFGNPKLVIYDFQKEYHNDLIVVGSTGKNFLERMLIGSVASYITRTAKCDVLVARTKKLDLNL